MQPAKLGIDVRVDGLPTEDHIADLLSREDIYIERWRACQKRVGAQLDAVYEDLESWAASRIGDSPLPVLASEALHVRWSSLPW